MPPPPRSPPPSFVKKQAVRASYTDGFFGSDPDSKKSNSSPPVNNSLNSVENAAYDLFDRRVMNAVAGWKAQYIANQSSNNDEDDEVENENENESVVDINYDGDISASTPHPSRKSSLKSGLKSTPQATSSPIGPKISLDDALWGGWRSFRDAVIALSLADSGSDLTQLIKQTEEQVSER